MVMTENRIGWIDWEKGFILLFVCLAHCGLWSPINGFHMAAFFFISGLLFNDKYMSIKKYILRKTKTLLVPYFFLSFLFLLFYRKLYVGFANSLFTYSNDIIQGYSSPNVGPLWFVYTLFQVTCLFYIIYIYAGRFFGFKEWILLLACSCFLGGWQLNRMMLPFKISTMITSMAFYLFGIYLQPFFFNKINNLIGKNLVVVCVICAFLWFIGHRMVNGVIGYNNNNLGDSLIGYFLVSIFGIYICTMSFYLLRRHKSNPVFILLKYIAENGIVILALHSFVINECNSRLADYVPENMLPYIIAIIVVVVLAICIPFFNKYLYWAIGKNKKTI